MRRRDAIELRHAHDLVSSIPDCLENGCEGCRAEAAMALDVIEHLLRRHSRPWRRAVLPHPRSSGGAPEEAPPPATRYVGEQRTSDDEARIERAARALVWSAREARADGMTPTSRPRPTMPDTTIRDGWAIGVAVYLNPFPPGSVGALHSEACVVVTGRTAQDVREALNVLDALRRRSHAPEADRA